MNEIASYIGTHERTLTELIDEGFGIPEQGVLLIYRDHSRERSVSLIFPNAASARARAKALIRMRRTSRRDVSVLPIAEALR